MMDRDWQAARHALRFDASSSPPGNAIIQYAAHGLIPARSLEVSGISWPREPDGRVLIPKEFWAAILSLTGGKYRDWESGVFRFNRAVGARYYNRPIEVLGVEFDINKCRDLFGDRQPSNMLSHTRRSVIADLEPLRPSAEPAGGSVKKNGGGRGAGKAGYAHAHFIVALQSMEHLADEKVDSLAALLAEEYEKIGLKPPAPGNLNVWVASMRRALLGEPAI